MEYKRELCFSVAHIDFERFFFFFGLRKHTHMSMQAMEHHEREREHTLYWLDEGKSRKSREIKHSADEQSDADAIRNDAKSLFLVCSNVVIASMAIASPLNHAEDLERQHRQNKQDCFELLIWRRRWHVQFFEMNHVRMMITWLYSQSIDSNCERWTFFGHKQKMKTVTRSYRSRSIVHGLISWTETIIFNPRDNFHFISVVSILVSIYILRT